MKCLKEFDPKMRITIKAMMVAEIHASAKTVRNFENCGGGSESEGLR
jgi:hypothetical protein